MQRYEMGTARVLPVLIRPADWRGAPFSKLQPVPTNTLPISEWKGRDAAFLDVVRHLGDLCSDLARVPGNPANPYVVATLGDWYQAELIMDIHATGQTKFATVRLTLEDKNDRRAVIRVDIKSADLGDGKRRIEIPLDRPLEDSYGPLVGAVSEQIPANATLESRHVNGGVEKLFIGGNTYYTTWEEKETELRWGPERLRTKNKLWYSSEIPLDGFVKTVMEMPDIFKQTIIVIGCGRGRQRPKLPSSHGREWFRF